MTIPRYVEDVIKLYERGQIPRGRLTIVDVSHDDHCLLLAGFGRCTCSAPSVTLRDDTPRRRLN